MFFKIMLNVFYSSIIIENEELIPDDGHPCIICANHSNSVMDAVVLVTSVSRKVLFTPQYSSVIGETETIAEYSERHNCQRKGYYKLVNQTKSSSLRVMAKNSGTSPDYATKGLSRSESG